MANRILHHRPPRIAFALLGTATAANWLLPWQQTVMSPLPVAALLTVAGGFSIMIAAWWRFRRRDVAICPTEPTAMLIRDGVYCISRNPMYLGMVVMLCGVALWFATAPFIVAAVTFFFVIDLVFCPYEERKLKAAFGAQYESYCNEVRRWF